MIMKVALQSKRENGAGTARESTRTLHQGKLNMFYINKEPGEKKR